MSRGLEELLLTIINKIDRIDEGLKVFALTQGDICGRLQAVEEEAGKLFDRVEQALPEKPKC